jgi:hypothetical protein
MRIVQPRTGDLQRCFAGGVNRRGDPPRGALARTAGKAGCFVAAIGAADDVDAYPAPTLWDQIEELSTALLGHDKKIVDMLPNRLFGG